MKKKLILFSALAALSIGALGLYLNSEATCSGGANCNACKNCKYCKNCSENGGTCSVCK